MDTWGYLCKPSMTFVLITPNTPLVLENKLTSLFLFLFLFKLFVSLNPVKHFVQPPSIIISATTAFKTASPLPPPASHETKPIPGTPPSANSLHSFQCLLYSSTSISNTPYCCSLPLFETTQTHLCTQPVPVHLYLLPAQHVHSTLPLRTITIHASVINGRW